MCVLGVGRGVGVGVVESAVASCKVMHGQYDLHAHSISACGIAWGLHCNKVGYTFDKFCFFVHVHNVCFNVILVPCHIV